MSDTLPLRGRRVVIFVEHDYDHLDLDTTRATLAGAGATVQIVGPIHGNGKELMPGRAPGTGEAVMMSGNRVRRGTLCVSKSISTTTWSTS